jgi:regulator of CtrA degradation
LRRLFFVPDLHSVDGAQLAKNFAIHVPASDRPEPFDAIEKGRRRACAGGRMSDRAGKNERTVELAERRVAGEQFNALFRDGMALVESTAAYLDGPGRGEAKALNRAAALAYATESMRLTTRLMQIASWLLLQRAVNEGELTFAQARSEKTKVKLSSWDPLHAESVASLPAKLRELIEASRNIHDQVIRLDQMIYEAKQAVRQGAENPVERQIDRLRAAFERAQR